MFQTKEISKELTWHADERVTDGYLRHPADSPAWKLVDNKWPEFGSEPRNLRLALSADGINPHSLISSSYSCWPVLLVTYNLPPQLCMKRKFIMLTLLISGPKQPGNDIDVYLAPLIDDLKKLWEVGIEAYDAYRKESFTLRLVLLWTINDFPAYGNLSGCSVKGYHACPPRGEHTYGKYLPYSRKICYTGHRRFLPSYHPYRRQKKTFDGNQEFNLAPKPLNGREVLERVSTLNYTWGKHLYGKLEEQNHLARFTFVNPFSISYVPGSDRDERARCLADRLADVSSKQIVLVPCNMGQHWILMIIEPHNEKVYLMDPLAHRNRDDCWKYIVDMAINMFNANKGKKAKKQHNWEIIKGPIQPDHKQCGYYVLRFMKEIIDGFEEDGSVSLKSLFQKKPYSKDEINEVRVEWASFVSDHL